MKESKSTRLQEVKLKFENWRGCRTQQMLPAELWKEAASLLGEFSTTRICRELRVHPNYLKKWAQGGGNPPKRASKRRNSSGNPEELGFVELPQAASGGGVMGAGGIQVQFEGRILGGRISMIVSSETSVPWEEIFSAWLRAEAKTLEGGV